MATSRVAFDTSSRIGTSESDRVRSPRFAELGRRIGLGFLAATVLAVAFATQSYASASIEGQHAEWFRSFRLQLTIWYSWALLFPLVATVGDSHPVRANSATARLPLWLLIGVLCAAVQSALSLSAGHFLGWLTPPTGAVRPNLPFGIWARFQSTFAANMLYFVLIALAIHLRSYSREARLRQVRESQLTARLAEAELHVLKTQLQPHFLFNTLNTVSALMETDTNSARTVLANLGDLLRLSLSRLGGDRTELREEFEFLEKYLSIQTARYGARLHAELILDPAVESALAPSLILQPIVENAVRYAIEPRRAPGHIRITASRRDELVRLEVEDDGPGLPATGIASLAKGIGLTNTEARLSNLYGARHRLSIERSRLGGFGVVMEFPYDDAQKDGPTETVQSGL